MIYVHLSNVSSGWLQQMFWLGGERNRNKEFRFRFRHCRYRNSGRKKNGKFVILWIDFREDIFPVHFYSESESNSLKSIQIVTNFPAFFLPEFLYRQCRNRNRNSLYLFRSPPSFNRFLFISFSFSPKAHAHPTEVKSIFLPSFSFHNLHKVNTVAIRVD